MDDDARADGSASRRVLLIGDGDLAEASHRALCAAGARVTWLRDPGDDDIHKALEEEFASVLVIFGDDHEALRMALLVEAVCPEVPMIVTVFARLVAEQLERRVRNARVVSMGDVVAPTFAGPCLDERFLTVIRTESGFKGVEMDADGPRLVSVETSAPSGAERILATLASFLRPFEHSARVLTIGLLGFLAIVVLDTVAMSLVVHQSLIDAFYYASKIIVTVGPNPAIDKGPEWFKVFSAGTMLGAVGFTAMFTAGIVERLLGRRLTTIIGRRMVPRKDHVVVVGLGQVGTRLCLLLRDLGIPVVTVDRDPDNYNVARAKDYGLPVAIGQGGSRFLLKRLALERARALAAVTDNALENIAVVVTALALQEDLRTLLRAGRGDVSNETRSLFQIGVVRDPYRIGGTLLAAAALGSDARDAFLHEQTVYLVTPEGELEPFEGDLEASRSDQGSSAEERASRAGADGA